jgi:hypothetical protein
MAGVAGETKFRPRQTGGYDTRRCGACGVVADGNRKWFGTKRSWSREWEIMVWRRFPHCGPGPDQATGWLEQRLLVPRSNFWPERERRLLHWAVPRAGLSWSATGTRHWGGKLFARAQCGFFISETARPNWARSEQGAGAMTSLPADSAGRGEHGLRRRRRRQNAGKVHLRSQHRAKMPKKITNE